MVTKRDDPNYSQVSGYIPKDLALRFKIACTSKEIAQSQAMEEAIQRWLEDEQTPPEPKSKRGRRRDNKTQREDTGG